MSDYTREDRAITLRADEEGARADKFISDKLDFLTRSAVQGFIRDGLVTIAGKPVLKSTKLSIGDEIILLLPEPEELDVAAENILLDIVYEDADLVVVNKPKGMVVHPAPGNYQGTLVNALLFHCKDSLSGINGVLRPGIVHRIDKDTSGLLIVAKNDKAHTSLAAQIKAHSFKREYQAIIYGNLKTDDGTIETLIGRNPRERKKMAVMTEGSTSARYAVTHYKVLSRYEGFTHVQLQLETGRTHQIRVHMAYIGHPVAGDTVYGPKKVITSLNGQCLHAKTIGFQHPATGNYMEFDSSLPGYFEKFMTKLKIVS